MKIKSTHSANNRLFNLCLITLLALIISACGGGSNNDNDDTATPSDEPLTLSLGSPSSRPQLIPPSDTDTQVTFLSIISGSMTPPEALFLQELDSAGNVINESVTQLRDNGINGDRFLGDRTYTGVAMLGDTVSTEKYYRVQVEVDGESFTSNQVNFWVSDCPVLARPSNPQNTVFDDVSQSFIFSNEIMVKLESGVAPDVDILNEILMNDVNGEIVGCIPNISEFLVEIPESDTADAVNQAIADLSNNDNFSVVSPNAQSLPQPAGEDGLCDGQDCQWYLEQIRAPQAWATVGAGDEETAVAVIDFGVDCNHTELGCDGDIYDQDIIDHGTGVAGLVNAMNGDNTPLVGVAWNADIYPYSFLSSGGSQYKMSELIAASMSEDNVKIINISAVTAIDTNNQIRDSICGAIKSGRLVVAAAGNAVQANSCEIDSIYPARYNTEGLMCDGVDLSSGLLVVGATDRDNNLAEWGDNCSNRLHSEILAPGVEIFTASSTNTDAYTEFDGTSFATPLVSGSAALLWSAEPALTVTEVHDRLVGSGTTLQSRDASRSNSSSSQRIEDNRILDIFSAVGGSSTDPQDTTPDSFTFEDKAGEPLQALSISNPITISGISSSAPIDITDGYYSIDGAPFTGAAGSIAVGQELRLMVITNDIPNSQLETTVTIGGISDTYNVTTGTIPSTLDNFKLLDKLGVPLGETSESNALELTGLGDETTTISIIGGQYSINGGAFTSEPGVINEGDTVVVSITAADTPATTNEAILTIGDNSENYSVTTELLDTEPDFFTFESVTSSEINTAFTSNTITVSGINVATPISISGGEYSINGGEFTNSTSPVVEGETVQVRANAPSTFDSETIAALTIGSVTNTFTITTQANSAPVASNVGILRVADIPVTMGTQLTGFYTYSDADDDAEGASTYRWLRNTGEGDVVIATTSSYTPEIGDVDQAIRFEVTPVAASGVITGLPVLSDELTVSAPPIGDAPFQQGKVRFEDLSNVQSDYLYQLIIPFNEDVRVNNSAPGFRDFRLPVSGDSIAGGTVDIFEGPASNEVTIGFNQRPSITVYGEYAVSSDIAGSPSGLSIDTTNAIISAETGLGVIVSEAQDIVGTFASYASIEGGITGGFDTADINGDGYADYINADSYWTNNTQGGFEPNCTVRPCGYGLPGTPIGSPQMYNLSGNGPQDFTVAIIPDDGFGFDLDGNDNAVASVGNLNGDFFVSWSLLTVNSFEPFDKYALGDFNNDGFGDALTFGLGRFNTVHLGNTINPAQNFGQFPSSDIAVGDVNNDGNLDLIAAIEDDNNAVYIGFGDGTFTDTSRTTGVANGTDKSLSLADMNGDNYLDLVVAQGNITYINFNDGTGNFDSTPQTITNAGEEVALGDFDGDNDIDIFIANSSGVPGLILFNDGDGTSFSFGGVLDGSFNNPVVRLGDIDKDGDLDLFVGSLNPNSTTVIYLNSNFSSVTPVLQPSGLLSRLDENRVITAGSLPDESGDYIIDGLSLSLNENSDYILFADITDVTPSDGNFETFTNRYFSDLVSGFASVKRREFSGFSNAEVIPFTDSEGLPSWANSNINQTVAYNSKVHGSLRAGQSPLNLLVSPQLFDYTIEADSSINAIQMDLLTQVGDFADDIFVTNEFTTLSTPLIMAPGRYWFDILIPFNAEGTDQSFSVEFQLVADQPEMKAIYEFSPTFSGARTLNELSTLESPTIAAVNTGVIGYDFKLAADRDDNFTYTVRMHGTIQLSQESNVSVRMRSLSNNIFIVDGGHISARSEKLVSDGEVIIGDDLF
ncbi:MAG: S8 family serine peptidase [Arenicella sp.]